MKQYSDAQLLLELQSGNDSAFQEIYERYADKLIAFALKKTQNEDEAMDMVQELFLSVWKNRYTIQVNGPLEAYLIVSVNYMAYKWFKKQSKQPQSLNDFMELPDMAEDSTAQKLSFAELSFLINREIADMPEKMRQVYLCSREQDMNGQQIAAELGISHQTVRNQISSALGRLKKAVHHYYNVIPPDKLSEFLLLIIFLRLL
ncbi:sigma-70 family RNA polymerase sigma factor [Mucilaginibacter sp. KACC 22773]|uniref:RNA polymerase sigma factor n=1 Tax=Mucilaginibacter sp. KACC 22773 TaxID=3025671 RepID=UPI0023662025|nr:sigma-70 family RNA polymerase sigma factor [Mucilaginibacter sp. KACC 22773]WDF76127.1 sigma-70 family RNA polymerase sigma factor [Mucilaginibacter sp. KACC 22773]